MNSSRGSNVNLNNAGYGAFYQKPQKRSLYSANSDAARAAASAPWSYAQAVRNGPSTASVHHSQQQPVQFGFNPRKHNERVGVPQQPKPKPTQPKPTSEPTNPSEFPPTMSAFIKRAFAVCQNEEEKKKMETKLHSIIMNHVQNQTIHSTDWAEMEVPWACLERRPPQQPTEALRPPPPQPVARPASHVSKKLAKQSASTFGNGYVPLATKPKMKSKKRYVTGILNDAVDKSSSHGRTIELKENNEEHQKKLQRQQRFLKNAPPPVVDLVRGILLLAIAITNDDDVSRETQRAQKQF